jgi:thioredoxin reductase
MLNTVIIGAGPYGLSLGAHFRQTGIPFRIFGRPMDSWLAHMPKGMMLKSDGFASNLSDPNSQLSLRKFCAERKIEYGDTGVPVRLDTFTSYGLTFQERMVPELEEKLVVSVDRAPGGFALRLDDGETFTAQRVILAVGITHFEYLPETLANLPAKYLSHSARHSQVEPFRGRNVVVLGGGASALDLAALLHEAGAEVQLVSRNPVLKFHGKPDGKPRTLWQKIRRPQSGLGPGYKSRFFANSPLAFHFLPQSLRLEAVRRALGPTGGWFIKDMVVGRVPTLLGYTPEGAEVKNGMVHLRVRAADGGEREVITEHIIAATGYRVDIERLRLLSAQLRSGIKTVNQTPVLSSQFESSVPGLYFAGVAAASSFGPLMRFAYGADFAARRITQAVKSRSHSPAAVQERAVATVAK